MKLRKYVTCGLITGLIALSGCGKNGNTEAVTEGTTAATEAVTEAVTEAATEVSTEASTEAVTEAVTETVTEEDNSSEAGQLYEDFKAGTAKGCIQRYGRLYILSGYKKRTNQGRGSTA